MDFLSNANKKIIWELLVDSNYFQDFPFHAKNDVKIIFDQTLNNIFDNKTSTDSLIDLNKKAVQNMILKRNAILRKERELYNNQTNNNELQNQQQSFNQNQSNNNDTNILGPIQQIYQRPQIKETNRVTAEDMRQIRELEFSRTLQTKQNEFSSLINANKPKDIDFSDKTEEQRIGADMDRLLEQVRLQREKELGITYTEQNIQQADEFIKNGNSNNDLNNNNSNNNNINSNKPKRLVIDKEDTSISSLTSSNNKKQVRFDEKNNEQISFIVEETNHNDSNNLSYIENEYENENKNQTIIENSNSFFENEMIDNSIENKPINTSSFLTKLKPKKNNNNNNNNNKIVQDVNLNLKDQEVNIENEITEIKKELLFLKNQNFDLFEQLKHQTILINELIGIVKNSDLLNK